MRGHLLQRYILFDNISAIRWHFPYALSAFWNNIIDARFVNELVESQELGSFKWAVLKMYGSSEWFDLFTYRVSHLEWFRYSVWLNHLQFTRVTTHWTSVSSFTRVLICKRFVYIFWSTYYWCLREMSRTFFIISVVI